MSNKQYGLWASRIVLSCAMGIAGVSTTALAQPEPQDSSTLSIGVNTGINTLDPALAGNGDPLAIFYELAYEPLIRMQPDGSYGPGLATEWRYADESNKVFEMVLREGVTFPDGSMLDADLVKAWLEYFGEAGGPFANRFDKMEAIEVTGPMRLRITLSVPNPELPYFLSQRNMTGSVVSELALADPEILGTSTHGAGQYVLAPEATVTNQTYVYRKNPDYWNPEAQNWDEITVTVIEDPNAMLQAMQAGQIDYAMGSPRTADAARDAGFEVLTSPNLFTQVQIMDREGEQVPALGDERVRKALNMSIRRDAIAKALFGNYGAGNAQTTVPGQDGWSDEFVDYYPYDLDAAKALLEEAGYADGFDLPMIAYNLQPGQTTAAQAIASEWSKLGVNTQISVPTSFPDFLAKFPDAPTMMFFYGVGPMYNMGSEWFFDGYGNPNGATDEVAEAIYLDAAEETDDAKREQLWIDFEKRLLDLAWMVPFGMQDKIVYVRPGLEGVVLTGANLDPDPVVFYAGEAE